MDSSEPQRPNDGHTTQPAADAHVWEVVIVVHRLSDRDAVLRFDLSPDTLIPIDVCGRRCSGFGVPAGRC